LAVTTATTATATTATATVAVSRPVTSVVSAAASGGVTLARTGFDAWVLALFGGLSLAGGLGLIAAQRRG
jgi:hypothetical protein